MTMRKSQMETLTDVTFNVSSFLGLDHEKNSFHPETTPVAVSVTEGKPNRILQCFFWRMAHLRLALPSPSEGEGLGLSWCALAFWTTQPVTVRART